jgi:hypothetical protein
MVDEDAAVHASTGVGKVEREQGYDYWISLSEELSTKLDTSAKGSH